MSLYPLSLPPSLHPFIYPSMHPSIHPFNYSENIYICLLFSRCCNRHGGRVEDQKDTYFSFKEFNWLWEREVTRYQEKCYKSWKYKALGKAKGEDYLFPSRGHCNLRRGGDNQAEPTKETEVPGKVHGGRVWRELFYHGHLTLLCTCLHLLKYFWE